MYKNFLCTSIMGHTLHVIHGCALKGILNHLFNVILGFIPRIQVKHSFSLDARVKPEYDYKVMQCGRSMIEMLGVLAIIGVLSVGGIAGYSKAMMKFKINKTIQQISEIATNIRTLYAQQNDYDGLNATTATQMGAIPDDLKTSTNRYGSIHITNVFGGELFVYGYGEKTGSHNGELFAIGLTGLPKEACVALTTADWGTRDSSGIIGVSIGSASGNAFAYKSPNHELESFYYSYFTDLPISPTEAAQYCQKVIESNYDGISFGFAK